MNPFMILLNVYLTWLACTLISVCVVGFGFILLIVKASKDYDATDRNRIRKTRKSA